MQSVMQHSFSQAPSAELPRSSFNRSFGYKTTFNAGELIPFFVDEVLPGDTVNLRPTVFCRMNTPIYPLMDNLFFDTHFFFVPYRQVWTNFRKFMGEQVDPGDSTDYTVPQMSSSQSQYINVGDVGDYMGLPIEKTGVLFSALPGRAYRHIYNEWYRDQNLVDSLTIDLTDGPDGTGYYGTTPYKRGKRHDYFTSALPWLQKGDAVDLPLGTLAPVVSQSQDTYATIKVLGQTAAATAYSNTENTNLAYEWPNVNVDLSQATASTVNELRQAFQIQKLLERDARSGTRYPEVIKAHFGVDFMDVTYRPEFLGGSSSPVQMQTVPQTSSTDVTSPQGNLSAYGTIVSQSGGITKSFTEHGLVMGIASVRADLTYSQGLERFWSRETRYDFYWPVLAHLGEQSILTKELYCQDQATDTGSTGTPDNERVFGYQERYAEYRYKPSKITGLMRPDVTGTLAAWHLSQEFSSLPELNQSFIEENPPMDRVVAVPSEPDFLMDVYFNYQHARTMPVYSVPGLVDHF